MLLVTIYSLCSFTGCPDWSSNGNSEYCPIDMKVSWDAADVICRSFSPETHLVYIESSLEQTILNSVIIENSMFYSDDFWLGHNDKDVEGKEFFQINSVYEAHLCWV